MTQLEFKNSNIDLTIDTQKVFPLFFLYVNDPTSLMLTSYKKDSKLP